MLNRCHRRWYGRSARRSSPGTADGRAQRSPAGPRPRRRVAGLGPRPPSRGPRREEFSRRLHDLLLRAARFEINRRKGSHPHLRGDDLDDLAHQAADDALLAILGKLDTYRGDSRFTTWAYKFALLEAAVKIRRRAWQGREVPIEPEHWSVIASAATPRRPRPRATSSSTRSQRQSKPSYRRISARFWSPSRSTTSRSTSSPSV